MKTLFRISALLFIFTFLFNCTKKEETPAELEINNFIWKGLNAYYLWQNDVPNLLDTRFSTVQQLNAYLGQESDANVFFESLLYQKDIIDKWSWIVDDYIALEQSFQGISTHNGMEFGLVAVPGSATDLFGYVRYVLPNSDAATQNVQRGMLFSAVDGTQITRSNYPNLLYNSDTYTINLADYNGGTPIANGTDISLTKSSYQENPVFISKTITESGTKIGYLMYNSFTPDFDGQLNAAFSAFKADGITELIIDLRYNGGGSVRTATYLSSMITGQFTGQVLAKRVWNSKVLEASNPSSLIDNFVDQIDNGTITEAINSLGLTKVYAITKGSTASASELVINSL
ncbi:MAG: peptidase S41, partial [Flavobacteriaceae bacterium]|nr:peptidase S41 [Flavobacteriaceae bacterium]